MKCTLLCWLSFAAAVAALTSCSPRPAGALLPPPKVTVAQPQRGTVTNWDEYPGHMEAVESVEIRPRVAGYIESIHFEDGAEVKAGDLLFVIDSKPYQADLDRAAAERLRGETRLELARNDLQRVEPLRSTKAISEEEYDTRQKAVREAEATVAAGKAAESAARINLDYTRIQAPITGRIGRRLVTVGNLVQGGGMMPGTIVATLVSQDPIYCYFDADERSLGRYRQPWAAGTGTLSGAALACELALVNEEGFPHQGRIDFFDNQVNAKSGTLRMRGVLANPTRALVAGMFAKVRVPAGPPVQALLIPAVAIGSDQGRKFVMVVNSNSVAELRPVVADRQHGALRAISSGLKPDDRVIVNGLMMARPGTKVEAVDASAPPPPPRPPAAR